jgi:feruloyl esterase
MNLKLAAALGFAATLVATETSAASSAATCESLRSVSIANVTISSADVVAPAPPAAGRGGRAGGAPAAAPAPGGARGPAPAGPPAAAAPPLPEYCRVRLLLTPTSDSKINAELWLPVTTWNGRFMAVGNGGFGGSIQGFGEMTTALRLGYATAGNDTGHSEADGPNGMFGLGHPEKIVDFAYRAMHEMTVTSKKLITEFYGRPQQFSYYKGCSTGGRQGAMNAQRYPDDFDGIIAGALANRHIQMHTAGVYRSIELARHPEMEIPPAKAQMVNKAVLNACDVYKEGFLTNPRACTFDFKKLACPSGTDNDSCLTAPQLKTVETFYGGVKNSKGELIFSGQALGNPLPPLRGATTTPGGGYDTVRIWGFQNADYDWHTFDLDRDMPIINSKVGFVDAVDPDLSKFKAHGGKLLLYAGWSDTTITPENTVLYYDNVTKKMGKQDDFVRLFMVPGMAHCRGGDGPNTFDSIGAMEAWREKGVTPTQLTGFNAQTSVTRPICSYPQFAKYKGTGNMKDAANWLCTQ